MQDLSPFMGTILFKQLASLYPFFPFKNKCDRATKNKPADTLKIYI